MAGDVVFGVHAVAEAIASGRGINRVYVAKESHAKAVKGLIDEARLRHIPFDFVPQAKLNELTGTQEHQGIAATVSPVEYISLDNCLAACPAQATLLVLDRVQHPKNLGMLIRTAVGAGASGVLLTERGGAMLDDTVLRASAGAVFRIPIVPCANAAQTARRLKEAGFWVYGLDAHATQSVFHTDWPDRCALLLGNESTGIRPGLRKACDALLGIPMAAGMDSLNVAVAAGIALFQIRANRPE